jgi:hypothetical protein
MGEEFYCILKLVSGEEVFSLIMVDESEEEPFIILQNPVIMSIFYSYGNSFIKMKPWIEMTDEDIFVIKLDKIITMTECKDTKIIKLYNNYINSESTPTDSEGKVNLTEEMGYKGSVENFRNKLEKIFKGIKES